MSNTHMQNIEAMRKDANFLNSEYQRALQVINERQSQGLDVGAQQQYLNTINQINTNNHGGSGLKIMQQPTQVAQPTQSSFDIGQFTSSFGNMMNNNMQNTMNSYMQTMNLQNQNLMNQFNQGQQQMMGYIGENNSSIMNSIGKKLSQQNMAMNNRMEYGMKSGVQGNVGIGQGMSPNRGSGTGFKTGVQQNNLNRFAGNLWGGGR